MFINQNDGDNGNNGGNNGGDNGGDDEGLKIPDLNDQLEDFGDDEDEE